MTSRGKIVLSNTGLKLSFWKIKMVELLKLHILFKLLYLLCLGFEDQNVSTTRTLPFTRLCCCTARILQHEAVKNKSFLENH